MTDPQPPDHAAWLDAVTRSLNGKDPATLSRRSDDGLAIGPLYPPGHGPVVWRGSGQACRVVQRVDQPDPAAANAQALADLEGGADGLTVVLADAGSNTGVSSNSPDDLDALFAGIRLDAIALRLDHADASRLGVATAILDRVHTSGLGVDLGLDPLGAMARTGRGSSWPSLATATAEAVAEVRRRAPDARVLRTDGRPHHDAGASEAQELAAVVATGIAALRIAEEAGVPESALAGALGFTLVADADVMLSVAKLRALRLLWARVEAACGLQPQAVMLHVETAWRTLTRYDPATNLLRGTLACSAALMGGADSVTVLPHTAALGEADADARRRARNTALVLMDEAGLGRVADPGAGSGAVEALTQALCVEAWSLVQTIEREGGMAAALTSGRWQARIEAMRLDREHAFRDGTRAIVGTTIFAAPDQTSASFPAPADGPAFPCDFAPLTPRRLAVPFESDGAAR